MYVLEGRWNCRCRRDASAALWNVLQGFYWWWHWRLRIWITHFFTIGLHIYCQCVLKKEHETGKMNVQLSEMVSKESIDGGIKDLWYTRGLYDNNIYLITMINEIFLIAIFDCPVLSCALMLKKEITAVETAVTGICFCNAWNRKIWVQSKLFRVANIDNTIPLLQCPYFHLERAEVFALLKLDLLDLFFPSTANLQYSYNMRWGTCRWVADLLISVFLLSEVHDTPSYKIFTCHFRLLLVSSEWYRFDMNCEQVIWAYKLKQLCQNIGK